MSFDAKTVEWARAWRDAAVADGWSIEPTYGDSESVDRAARLSRVGWMAQVITRTPIEGNRHANYYCGTIHVWGPDGLAVSPGHTYDWAHLVAGLRTCSACKATDVDTERYGFAGRCCAACLPTMRARTEQPGWNN